jgi:hypothetical protein
LPHFHTIFAKNSLFLPIFRHFLPKFSHFYPIFRPFSLIFHPFSLIFLPFLPIFHPFLPFFAHFSQLNSMKKGGLFVIGSALVGPLELLSSQARRLRAYWAGFVAVARGVAVAWWQLGGGAGTALKWRSFWC